MKMNLPHRKQSHFPKPKKEESEFGKGKKNIVLCRNCNAVYFYKSWHHRLEDYPEISKEKSLNFSLCPACRAEKEGTYEGKVVIENIDVKIKEDLLSLINNFGREARERDPQDRILKVKQLNKNKIIITTTENQLAVRLAKKIKKTFGGEINIRYSKDESSVFIKVIF
ncbi:MAG: hypothetical protein PHO31_01360 [Candidatus Pacebacteria bacterium]|nr:hypothetical protein [Candidatus Paceibacterota bacterium]